MDQLALELQPDERAPVTRARRQRRQHLHLVHAQLELDWPRRRIPQTRGDCSWARDSAGYPCCPYLSCRHHLWSDTPERLDEFEALVDRPPGTWPQTCSLDVADAVHMGLSGATLVGVGRLLAKRDPGEDGTLRLIDVGRHLGISGERARQIEASAAKRRGDFEQALYGDTGDVDWLGDDGPTPTRDALLAKAAALQPKLDPRPSLPVRRLEVAADDDVFTF